MAIHIDRYNYDIRGTRHNAWGMMISLKPFEYK